MKSSRFAFGYTLAYDFEINNDNNLKFLHHMPAVSYRLNNHYFYLGPQYSFVFQPDPVANELYENNAYGLNFGYRYYSDELFRNFTFFGQFHYSIFQTKSNSHQKGGLHVETRRKVFVSNTATVGGDYLLVPNLHIFAGTGIGSYDGFF